MDQVRKTTNVEKMFVLVKGRYGGDAVTGVRNLSRYRSSRGGV